MRPRILIFCEHYLPGNKSGGGMWTVVNLVDRFSDQYDFFVITRNHDGKADSKPYSSVQTGSWNTVRGHKVYYVDPKCFGVAAASDLFGEVDPQLVFLNSAFSLTGRMFLEARRKHRIPEVPVVLAPCGEVSDGCMSIKPLKKLLFLKYANLFGLYENVIWKASAKEEFDDIRRRIGDRAEIMTAPDLLPRSILPDFDPSMKPDKSPGHIKLVTVARITQKKNLLYLFERLTKLGDYEVELEVIGPVEDQRYWEECQSSIYGLPPNIRVNATGNLDYSEVLERMINSHFFVLPTLHENFGYVFVEAMSAGCPLLLSENTIWENINEANAGCTIPLDDKLGWEAKLKQFAEMDQAEFREMSNSARRFAVRWLDSSVDMISNQRVLDRALGDIHLGH